MDLDAYAASHERVYDKAPLATPPRRMHLYQVEIFQRKERSQIDRTADLHLEC